MLESQLGYSERWQILQCGKSWIAKDLEECWLYTFKTLADLFSRDVYNDPNDSFVIRLFRWPGPKFEARILCPWLFPCQRSPPQSALHVFEQGARVSQAVCMVGHPSRTNHTLSSSSCSTTYLPPQTKLDAAQAPPNLRYSRPTRSTQTSTDHLSTETSAIL